MLEIKTRDLYDAWLSVNKEFIERSTDDAYLLLKRDFALTRYNVILKAENLKLPEEWPPFFTEQRLKRLAGRYINTPLWEEDISRIRNHSTTKSSPKSMVVMFRRQRTSEAKIPKGGGCLVSLSFTWFKNKWHIHVLSRASEITARLLSDMYFVRRCIDRVVEEGNIKGFDPDNTDLIWNILLPTQLKYMVPLFLLLTEGREKVKEYLLTDDYINEWHKVVQDHFWKVVIYPDKIKWKQRARWCEKFLSWSKINWHELNPLRE